MPSTLRYIGANERYFETAVTGSQQMWLRNQSGEVSDAHALLLLATGLFERYERDPIFEQHGQIVTPSGEVVGGVPGLVNWKYSNTRPIAAAYLGAVSGAIGSRMYVSGDSGLAGTGATNNSTTNARPLATVAQLARLIRNMGGEADANWVFAGGMTGATLTSIAEHHTSPIRGTSLVHSASGVTYDTSKPGPTGGNWQVTTAGTITIKPELPFDTVHVLHGKAPAFGTLVLKDQAGVTAGTINCNIATGDNTMGLASVTFPAGSTSVEISVTGSTTRFVGVGFSNSATPGMQIINMSSSGQGVEFLSARGITDPSYLSADAAYLNLITAGVPYHVAMCGGGANDWNAGRTFEQIKGYYRLRYDRLLERAAAAGVQMGMFGYGVPPAAASEYAPADREAINTCIKEVTVDEYDLPFISPFYSLPPHEEMQSAGMGASDGRHLRAAGQNLVAGWLLAGMQYAASLKS